MAARASAAWTLPGSVLAQADSETQANACQQNNRGGFFQTCLAKSKGSTPPEVCRWRRRVYDEIRTRMPLQGGLSIERMCQLAEVSLVGFYRYLRAGWPAEEEVDLRSAVQDVVLEHWWRYEYRRVTAELQARGMIVNHKWIARIMREDDLLAFHRSGGLKNRRLSWSTPNR